MNSQTENPRHCDEEDVNAPSGDVPGMVQCGWAYQDKRWDADRWHVCGFENKPREHEGRLVRPIYVPAGDGVPGMVLDDRERMLLGWMLAAFEQSKVGWQITDDLKREMRDANRLVARLSASSAGKETP